MKVSGNKFIFPILYIDYILLATNDLGLLSETERFLSNNFEIKDIDEAYHVIGLLGLSQKTYIKKVLERFKMDKCSSPIPIQKGDKFSLMQCPKNDLEWKHMENIPYAFVVGSLMYAQTCKRPDIIFVVGMLGRYQSNPRLEHWKATKKV